MLRRLLKGTVEAGLAYCGPATMVRRLRRNRVVILAYHNIVPNGEVRRGDLSLHMRQGDFATQLDILVKTHDVVPLHRVLENHGGGRPRAAITFDDAYRGALTAGMEELVARRFPATIFVAPEFLDGGAFWWDELAGEGGLDPRLRDTALGRMAGKHSAIMEWAATNGPKRQPLPDHATVASEAELTAAVLTGMVSVGSHTWSHPNLAAIDRPAELEEEISRPAAWIRERFPEAQVPWIAYPYGLYNATVTEAAERCGNEGGLKIDGGCFNPGISDVERHAIPRLNVPAGVSAAGFTIRVSGVLAR